MEMPKDIVLPTSKNETGWNLDSNGYFIRNDGRHFNPRPELEEFIRDDARFILLKSGRGGGKALALDTEILTQNRGWTTMGDIQVGDYVFGKDGLPTKVDFVSDVMYDHFCYKLTLIDGTEIVADAEHLWEVLSENQRVYMNRGKGNYEITETQEMANRVVRNQNGRTIYNYTVDNCNPIFNSAKVLPLHPYVLGAWLGDGASRDAIITISPDDHEMVDIIEGFGYPLHSISDEYTWSFAGDGTFKNHLRSLNVWKNKHIPTEYLQGAIEQRLALLQGLMDTDGTISQRGHCSFDNKNLVLAKGVHELVSSLGMKCTLSRYEINQFDTPTWSYKVSFTPSVQVFQLSRKLQRQKEKYNSKRNNRRAIVSIIEVPSTPVRCIQVQSSDHLFLVTRSFIPTHNTTSAVQKALHKIKLGQSGAVMSPSFENFRTSTWPEFRDWIPWQMVVPKHRFRNSPSWEPIKPFSIVFINGAHVYCKGLKDPESARGSNVNWFWYDEGRRDVTGLGWKNAIAFCRVGDKPQAFCTTTMAETDHWTNTFFNDESTDELQKIIDDLKKKGLNQKLFSIHKTSTKDNVDNLDPMFYASLLSAYPSGYLRQRELDGEAADEGGSLGDRSWFIGKNVPSEPDWVVKKVRFWDLAGTEKKILKGKKMNDPDETVGSLVGTDEEKNSLLKKFVILDQIGGYWAWSKLKEVIVAVTKEDGPSVYVCFEQEPASGGKNQVAELKELLKKECPWVQFSKGKKSTDIDGAWNPKDAGDRVMGANTWFAEAQTIEVEGTIKQGQWYYIPGLWTEKFFTQLDTFNGIAHDDRVTSITGARHVIAPIQKKWSSPKFLALGGTPEAPKQPDTASMH